MHAYDLILLRNYANLVSRYPLILNQTQDQSKAGPPDSVFKFKQFSGLLERQADITNRYCFESGLLNSLLIISTVKKN